jgi:hypothetical protein
MSSETKKIETNSPQSTSKITKETQLAVWEAEDGRCEVCKRPMNREMASFSRVDARKDDDWSADNLHLICIDCKAGKPDLLTHVTIWGKVVKKLAPRLSMSEEETTKFLPEVLFQYGVLLSDQKWYREYWIPRIGVFRVVKWEKAAVTEAIRVYKRPKIKEQSQARTRGLPKPYFTKGDAEQE